MLKIAIIDDKAPTRVGLHDFLAHDSTNFHEVQAYPSINELLEEDYLNFDLDVIVLDMNIKLGIPPLDGLDLLRKNRCLRHVNILMLTSLNQSNYTIFKLLCSKASSFIDTEKPFSAIREAILALKRRGPLISKSLVKLKLRDHKNPGLMRRRYKKRELTLREVQIIQAIMQHETEWQICHELRIQIYLLRRYIRSAYRKLYYEDPRTRYIPYPETMITHKRVVFRKPVA